MKPRKEPLKRTGIKRKVPMRCDGTPVRKGPVKQRRPSVTPEERRARKLVRARSGGVCEIYMCGGAPGSEWSHRKRRSQGGPWEAVNGLLACHQCHLDITLYESQVRAEDRGWVVKMTGDPASIPVLRRGDWVLLDDTGGWEPVNPEAIGGAA